MHHKESYNGSINYNTLISHNIFRVPRQLQEEKLLPYEPLVIAIEPYCKSRKMQPSVTEAFMMISAMNLLLAPPWAQRFRRLHETDHQYQEYSFGHGAT